MKVLGIIPARSGSKGVPGKNVLKIAGKPLLLYSIEVALASQVLHSVYVSSDGDEILDLTVGTNAVPLKRPADLATDMAEVTGVIRHALAEAEKTEQIVFDAIMLLQPTAPMREEFHLQEAISVLKNDPNVQSVISVCEMQEVHPARMYSIKEGILEPFIKALEQTRRQDIPPVYYRNGSIYLVRRDAFVHQGSVMAKPSAGYVMSSRYLANIDEPRDVIIAEALIKAWKAEERS